MKKNKEEKIKIILKEWARLVDPKIKEVLNLYLNSVYNKTVGYQMEAGGKRLRPAFVFASCLLLGGKIKDAVYPAVGVEILHNYTLIIDDIIDNSEIRRRKLTVWKKYGKDIAQCIGIVYSASIFQAAQNSKNPLLISEIIAETMKILVDGEILDIIFERAGRKNEPFVLENRYKKISKKDCLLMMKKKTAVFFGSCCQIGGICAKGNKKQLEALKKYGINVGIAFQIRDDILDTFGKEKDFGKEIGKDIKEHKGGNIVNALALEELKPKEKKEFIAILEKEKISKKEVERSIKLIQKTKAREKSQRMAEYYIKKAKRNLKNLPQNKWNHFLTEIADFVVEREK